MDFNGKPYSTVKKRAALEWVKQSSPPKPKGRHIKQPLSALEREPSSRKRVSHTPAPYAWDDNQGRKLNESSAGGMHDFKNTQCVKEYYRQPLRHQHHQNRNFGLNGSLYAWGGRSGWSFEAERIREQSFQASIAEARKNEASESKSTNASSSDSAPTSLIRPQRVDAARVVEFRDLVAAEGVNRAETHMRIPR